MPSIDSNIDLYESLPRNVYRSTAGENRIILLVHGFNVNKKDAYKRYNQFRRNLTELTLRFIYSIRFVFWPGKWGLLGLNNLTYAISLRNAVNKANQLSGWLHEYIRRNGKPTEIVLIGHSLGCRLILESIRDYYLVNNLRYDSLNIKAVLMAAAVPVQMVLENGRLKNAALEFDKSLILFSNSDQILRWAFPVGQLHGERHQRSLWPVAVGLHGHPAENQAGQKVWSRRIHQTGNGHGDYWPHTSTIYPIASFLNMPVARGVSSRAIGTREIGFPRSISLR